MESWLMPISILPGIGLMILSTVNLSTSLSGEISALLVDCRETLRPIIQLKITQLKRLNWALVMLYFAAISFIAGAIILGLSPNPIFGKIALTIGTLSFLIALIILIVFGFWMVRIKNRQFEILAGNK
ncbi:MAG: hypothetical protein JKX84_00260 [Flavobacteriales bacterium]|nr:hypothetical protein [Flavobacteriales bacterium]